MSFKLEWIDNNPFVSFEGDISFEEIYQIDGQIYGDSRFDLTNYLIYNFLEVRSLDIAKNEIKVISTLDKSASRWNNKVKIACVAQDYTIKKLIIDYISFMDDNNWEIKIVDSIDEAINWCRI